MKVFDDKYKFKDPRIQPRMQLRSDICKHFESWNAESRRRVKNAFAELRETVPDADRGGSRVSQPAPALDWTRKPLKQ